jgi:hypothetical protein
MMEACSVCTCDESEIPKTWLEEMNERQRLSAAESSSYATSVSHSSHADIPYSNHGRSGRNSGTSTSSSGRNSPEMGWISTGNTHHGFAGQGHDDVLGRIKQPAARGLDALPYGGYIQFLEETEECQGTHDRLSGWRRGVLSLCAM